MRKREILLIILLISFGLFYHAFRNIDYGLLKIGSLSFESTRLVSDTFFEFQKMAKSFKNIEKIEIVNIAGSISIEQSSSDQVFCQVYANVYLKQLDKAKKISDSLVVVEEWSGNELRIFIRSGRSFPFNKVRFVFKVYVPESVNIKVINALGPVNLKNIMNNTAIKEEFGPVLMNNIHGNVDLECNYVNLKATNISGKIKLASRFSEIKVEGVEVFESKGKFDTVDITKITNFANISQYSGSVQIENANNISIQGRDSQIRVSNINSRLLITNTNKQIKLKNVSGLISIDSSNSEIVLEDCLSDKTVLKNKNEAIKIRNFIGSLLNIQLQHGALFFNFVELKGDVKINAEYSDISIGIPKAIAPTFIINNRFGSIIDHDDVRAATKVKSDKYFIVPAQFPRFMINLFYSNISIKHQIP